MPYDPVPLKPMPLKPLPHKPMPPKHSLNRATAAFGKGRAVPLGAVSPPQ